MMDFLTKEALKTFLRNNDNYEEWYSSLIEILPKYDINTVDRVAMFLAQTAYESSYYNAIVENLNYRASSLMAVWPSRFPSLTLANEYAHQPEKIANYVYANRMGNGDVESGDGYKFRGRGLIQITGKENYQKFADDNNIGIDDTISFLTTTEGAVTSACWFFQKHDINSYADRHEFTNVTKIINGGTNGLRTRLELYHNVFKLLGDSK